jgi:hypothetical protein
MMASPERKARNCGVGANWIVDRGVLTTLGRGKRVPIQPDRRTGFSENPQLSLRALSANNSEGSQIFSNLIRT